MFFGSGPSPKGSWRSLYKLPIEKRTGDLQWRIVHGAIATNRFRAHIDSDVKEDCLFCARTETVVHIFVECPRLVSLFELLKKMFRGLGETFSFNLFIFDPKYFAKKKYVITLLNFLSGSAKLAIWLTRRNRTQNSVSTNAMIHFSGHIKGSSNGRTHLLHDGKHARFHMCVGCWGSFVFCGKR